jgi:4-carboxymuconolactone decarboxylase
MKKVTAGRDAWSQFAPQFGELNDEVLFGQVWARDKQLSPRDRSMITISAIFSSGMIGDAFKAHLRMGKANGITKEEIVEMITQLAFYCGWPKAWAALPLVKEVFDDAPDGNSHEPIFGKGNENEAYARYFTGKSYLQPMVAPSEGNDVNVANVTFEPGCRNNWHSHTRMQILLVTDGEGLYQEWGKPARRLQKGDIVEIPVGVKHWHGATARSYFTHIALMGDVKNAKNEWLESVSDEQYGEANKQQQDK